VQSQRHSADASPASPTAARTATVPLNPFRIAVSLLYLLA